jgi:hypothetical protein
MEKCAHCGDLNSKGAQWKQFSALYYEVEIKHSVCPKCSSGRFPKLYNIREYRIQVDNRLLNTGLMHPNTQMKKLRSSQTGWLISPRQSQSF